MTNRPAAPAKIPLKALDRPNPDFCAALATLSPAGTGWRLSGWTDEELLSDASAHERLEHAVRVEAIGRALASRLEEACPRALASRLSLSLEVDAFRLLRGSPARFGSGFSSKPAFRIRTSFFGRNDQRFGRSDPSRRSAPGRMEFGGPEAGLSKILERLRRISAELAVAPDFSPREGAAHSCGGWTHEASVSFGRGFRAFSPALLLRVGMGRNADRKALFAAACAARLLRTVVDPDAADGGEVLSLVRMVEVPKGIDCAVLMESFGDGNAGGRNG